MQKDSVPLISLNLVHRYSYYNLPKYFLFCFQFVSLCSLLFSYFGHIVLNYNTRLYRALLMNTKSLVFSTCNMRWRVFLWQIKHLMSTTTWEKCHIPLLQKDWSKWQAVITSFGTGPRSDSWWLISKRILFCIISVPIYLKDQF